METNRRAKWRQRKNRGRERLKVVDASNAQTTWKKNGIYNIDDFLIANDASKEMLLEERFEIKKSLQRIIMFLGIESSAELRRGLNSFAGQAYIRNFMINCL